MAGGRVPETLARIVPMDGQGSVIKLRTEFPQASQATVASSTTMTVTAAFLRSLYFGIAIENILYGIELVLYFKTIYVLLANRGTYQRYRLCYALFSTMMVFLVTVWITTQVIFSENMWLLHPNFPGGAVAYWKVNIGVWYMDLAATTVVVLQLMTDALVIHRCWVIWGSYRVIVAPLVLWIATLVLGILVAWLTSAPGADFYSGIAAHFSLAYWSTSVSLHSTSTCMICYYLLRHGRMVEKGLGREYAFLYFGIVSVVVESVLPYTLSGIAFLVALGVNSPTSTALIRVYFMMMCISPQMLILRRVTGKAWGGVATSRPSSTICFGPSPVETQSRSLVDREAEATARASSDGGEDARAKKASESPV